MYGTLYLIPCPISDETAPWDVLPAANRAVMDSLDYFIVENTRSARRFLSRAGIQRPIDSLRFAELNEHSTPEAVAELLTPVLAGTLMRNISYKILFPYAAVFVSLSFVTMCFVRHGDGKAEAKTGLSAFEDID